jgi:hypothetical protein
MTSRTHTPEDIKKIDDEFKEVLSTRLFKEKKEWQGLTDEERNTCLVEADPCEALLEHEAWQLMRDIEAKLKEKNT